MQLFGLLMFLCIGYESCMVQGYGIEEPPSPFGSLGFTTDVNVREKVFIDNFVALPAELKLIILGNLPPKDLFDFTQIEEFNEYHHLATKAYGTSYGDVIVYMKKSRNGQNFHFENDIIHFNDLSVFHSALITFKKHIRNLKINISPLLDYQFNKTVELIGENCAEQLTKLEFRYIHEDDLDVIQTISFPKVEELSLFHCEFDSNEMHQFKEIFPNVRRLSATSIQAEDPMWVERNFLNLTHFQGEIDVDFFSASEIQRILNANPEITSLGLHWSTPDMLRTIDERFPNIVDLAVAVVPDDFFGVDEIYMKHVETFLFEGLLDIPMPVTIENLKELQWHGISDLGESLIGFIQKHKDTIERLEIKYAKLTDKHLNKMIYMTKLKRVSINYIPTDDRFISAEGVFFFIRNNPKLVEVQIIQAEQELREEIYKKFKSSGLKGQVNVFDIYHEDDGDIHYIRNENYEFKRDDPMEFFKNHFF